MWLGSRLLEKQIWLYVASVFPDHESRSLRTGTWRLPSHVGRKTVSDVLTLVIFQKRMREGICFI